jgi:hypothetical protein
MPHFYDPADRRFLGAIQKHATPECDAYAKLNATVFGREDGAIDRHTRGLTRWRAIVSQCPFCIQSHTRYASTEFGIMVSTACPGLTPKAR